MSVVIVTPAGAAAFDITTDCIRVDLAAYIRAHRITLVETPWAGAIGFGAASAPPQLPPFIATPSHQPRTLH